MSLTLVSLTPSLLTNAGNNARPPRSYITLVFSASISLSGNAAEAENWVMTPSEAVTTPKVTPSPIALSVDGTTLTLVATEHTTNCPYTLTIPTGITSGSGDYAGSDESYSGPGLAPFFTVGRGVDEKHLEVVFSEPMGRSQALDPDEYRVIGASNVDVTGVERVDDQNYTLTTSALLPSESYQVVAESLRDLAENPISGDIPDSMVAGVDINALGRPVAIDDDGGTPALFLGDANGATARRNSMALAAVTGSSGDFIELVAQGPAFVGLGVFDVEPSITDAGSTVYLSETAGNLTLDVSGFAAGSDVRAMGYLADVVTGLAVVFVQPQTRN